MEYEQQILEALEEVYAYNKKLIVAVDEIVLKLREGQKDDTKELLFQIVEGINWEFQVIAHGIKAINEKDEVITKEYLSSIANKLTKIIADNDYLQLADTFEKDVVILLNKLQSAISAIVDIKEN